MFRLITKRPTVQILLTAVAQVQEKRLEAAREEEKMLEAKRQLEEEQGPGADKALVKSSKAALDATAKDQVSQGRPTAAIIHRHIPPAPDAFIFNHSSTQHALLVLLSAVGWW